MNRQGKLRRAKIFGGQQGTVAESGMNPSEDAKLLKRDEMAWSCDPVKINYLTYVGTSVIFIIVFFLDMPRIPYPVEGCLLTVSNHGFSKDFKYLAFALWNLHFVRRSTEVLFVHLYKRRMPLIECIGAPVYYWIVALFIAWSINGESYNIPSLSSAVIGTIIFLVGEVGNAWCHVKLRFLRTKTHDAALTSPDTGHVLPQGVFFNHVSCPHYLFEIITWIGFFLVIWTLPSALLLLFTIITLAIYSDKKHTAYLNEFDGEYDRPHYPESRKRLVPYLF